MLCESVAGHVGIERGIAHVRGHDQRGLLERLAERDELAGLERHAVGVAHRQRQVRVDDGRAVAGEVLRAGVHAALAQAAQHRGAEARDLLGRARERARADHRIARLDVDVEHGREVDVDARGREPRRRRPSRCARPRSRWRRGRARARPAAPAARARAARRSRPPRPWRPGSCAARRGGAAPRPARAGARWWRNGGGTAARRRTGVLRKPREMRASGPRAAGRSWSRQRAGKRRLRSCRGRYRPAGQDARLFPR